MMKNLRSIEKCPMMWVSSEMERNKEDGKRPTEL